MDQSRPFLPTRAVLARIRCLQESIECYRNSAPMPEAFCYVPATVEYKISRSTSKTVTKFPLYKNPDKNGGKTMVSVGEENCGITASGMEMCNCHGQWLKLEKGGLTTKDASHKNLDGWLLLYDRGANPDDPPWLVKVEPQIESSNKQRLFGKQEIPISRWEEAVEVAYSLRKGRPPPTVPTDPKATDALRQPPSNWSLESDEELAKFLFEHTEQDNENLGSVKQFVESVDVSSTDGEDQGAACLTDGDESTYWESDGTQGQHWIRLVMKKGTIIKKLYITIDAHDENYLPTQVVVMGGEGNNMEELNSVNVDSETNHVGDICILEDMARHFPTIEIKITACKEDGIDCRIHGIKIKSTKQRDLGLKRDIFSTEELVRYPRLELVDTELLYRRSLLLNRFIRLLDSILHYIVPAWKHSVGSFSSLEVVRQFLPLSKKRNALIDHFLRQSETVRPHDLPKLYINRRSAADHRSDPTQDPQCKSAVFSQVFEGLKPKDRNRKPLDYRWPQRYDQWWECKFLSEGIIDQGGGFRDSLSDIAEELCPTNSEQPVPLPFFIRSPNQKHDNSNVYRDTYIPNPSCDLMAKYEWIGMIMGACLRSKEHLVLALPSFVWKLLAGERVTWSRDYLTVDAAAVKLTETIEKMDKETFGAHFADELTYTTVLSDHRLVDLKGEGSEVEGSGVKVQYEDRIEFCKLMQNARMQESKAQVEAIRKGLLRVIPQAVLDLLTWQELEKRICGDPEISVDALKKTTFYEDVESSDIRVNYLWEALTNFTNEDRSRFLRFVTGRRRLPAPLYVCLDRGDKVDSLPESSTCSNTLFLPNYSSAKVAEEKLRYAAYNCVAIDTDMSPWDE